MTSWIMICGIGIWRIWRRERKRRKRRSGSRILASASCRMRMWWIKIRIWLRATMIKMKSPKNQRTRKIKTMRWLRRTRSKKRRIKAPSKMIRTMSVWIKTRCLRSQTKISHRSQRASQPTKRWQRTQRRTTPNHSKTAAVMKSSRSTQMKIRT